jgi:hypothetical protein
VDRRAVSFAATDDQRRPLRPFLGSAYDLTANERIRIVTLVEAVPPDRKTIRRLALPERSAETARVDVGVRLGLAESLDRTTGQERVAIEFDPCR